LIFWRDQGVGGGVHLRGGGGGGHSGVLGHIVPRRNGETVRRLEIERRDTHFALAAFCGKRGFCEIGITAKPKNYNNARLLYAGARYSIRLGPP